MLWTPPLYRMAVPCQQAVEVNEPLPREETRWHQLRRSPNVYLGLFVPTEMVGDLGDAAQLPRVVGSELRDPARIGHCKGWRGVDGCQPRWREQFWVAWERPQPLLERSESSSVRPSSGEDDGARNNGWYSVAIYVPSAMRCLSARPRGLVAMSFVVKALGSV